jgi:prolyl-tRNA synthetase
VKVVIRHSGEKFQMSWHNIGASLNGLLDKIHDEMYKKADQARSEHTKHVENWDQFMEALDQKFVCLAPWCDTVKCED